MTRRMEENARTLAVMLDVLAELGAEHVVFGGLLASHYGRNRATADVDMLVPRRFVKPLQAALERRKYEARLFPYVLKMYIPGEAKSVGDFVAQETNDVVRAAFAGAVPAEILGFPVSVVPRGVFVAMKFQAAITPTRRSRDTALDVADIRGVIEKGFGPEDELLAVELAAKMYPGAVTDFKGLIGDLRRGQWPRVTRRTARRSGLLVRRAIAALR